MHPNDAIVRVHVCTYMHMCMHMCIRVCVKGNMRTTGVSSSEGVAPPSTYRLQGMFSVSPHVCLTRSLLWALTGVLGRAQAPLVNGMGCWAPVTPGKCMAEWPTRVSREGSCLSACVLARLLSP